MAKKAVKKALKRGRKPGQKVGPYKMNLSQIQDTIKEMQKDLNILKKALG